MQHVRSLDGAETGSLLADGARDASNARSHLATLGSRSPLTLMSMSSRPGTAGSFALSDERGKVFTCDPDGNTFEVAKKATTLGPLSSLCHLHSKANVLLLGYSSGAILVYDVEGKKALASLQTPSGLAPRLMRAHPTKSMAVVADAAHGLSVWDLRHMRPTLSMPAGSDEVVDVAFIEGGAMIALLMRHSGLHVYRSSDMRVALRCPFPDSERRPTWTALCSAPSPMRGSVRFLLAGDNATLYLWETEMPFDLATDVAERAEEAPICGLVGLVDLPPEMVAVGAMAFLGAAGGAPQLQPQVLVLSRDGVLAVLDAQGFGGGSVGIWTVLADLPASVAAGAPEEDGEEQEVGGREESKAGAFEVASASPLPLGHGSLAAGRELFLVLARGCARLFDLPSCLGSGVHVASMLRTRAPHPVAARVPVFRVVEGQRVVAQAPRVRERTGLSATARAADKAAVRKAQADVEAKTAEADKRRQIKAKRAKEAQEAEMNRYSDVDDVKEMKALEPRKESAASRGSAPSGGGSSGGGGGSSANPGAGSFPPGFSLYEMACQAPAPKLLTEGKLRTLLQAHHEFPARYRQVVWRFLLRLPENTHAFADLVRMGEHAAYERLHEKYPVRSRRLFHRLQGLCSQLAHWAPIMGELSYLPQFIFPFVVVFGVDELAALECVMTIFMWWGYSWHATYPQPPVHLLDALDRLLLLHDSKLHGHMCKYGAPPGLVGWNVVSTLFTELLGREDWFRLMDHVFVHVAKPQYLYVAVVAVLHCIRGQIMARDSPADIIECCRRQQSVDFAAVSRVLTVFMAATPAGLLAGVLPMNKFDHEHSQHAQLGQQANEVAQARECLALHAGHALFPLPSGRYPAYDGYPAYIVDWQLRDRTAALELGQAGGGDQEDVLGTLRKRVDEANDHHKDFAAAREQQARQEEASRKAAMDRERRQLAELQRIEEEISRQRVAGLGASERAAQDQLHALEQAKAETEATMRAAEGHMAERSALALGLQRQREVAEQAEAAMQHKLSTLHVRRSKEQWVQSVERGYEEKERELEARDALLRAQQLKAEEQYQQRREARQRLAAFEKEEEDLVRVHDDMTARMQRLVLSREAEAVDLERQRALRAAKEQADEALEASQRTQHLLRKHEAAAALASKAQAEARGKDRTRDSYRDMLEVVRSDGDRAAAEERQRVFAERLGSERVASRDRQQGLVSGVEARFQGEIVERVAVQGAVQERQLGRGDGAAEAGGAAGARQSDDSSVDAILAGLGAQIKQQVRDGVPDEGEGDELEAEGIMNDSALWAYDDPSEG